MEEMKKVAIACYKKADVNTQKIAKQFFDKIDKDGNGEINQNEYKEALNQLGLIESEEKQLANLFEKFDTNRDKRLDFDEAAALYYVIKHTLFCSECCALLTGIYFSCSDCYMKSDGKTYDVCVDCYRNGKSDNHEHTNALYDIHRLLQIFKSMIRVAEEEGATNLKDTATATSRGTLHVLKKFVPKILRTSVEPDSTENGTGSGTVSAAGAGLDATAGSLGSGGVGAAKVGGLSDLAGRGMSGMSYVADAISDACSIM